MLIRLSTYEVLLSLLRTSKSQLTAAIHPFHKQPIVFSLSRVSPSTFPFAKCQYLVKFSPYMTLTDLSSKQLIRAAKIKEQIEALNKQLRALLGGSGAMPAPRGLKKGQMSAAGRAR